VCVFAHVCVCVCICTCVVCVCELSTPSRPAGEGVLSSCIVSSGDDGDGDGDGDSDGDGNGEGYEDGNVSTYAGL
jgi:hypothetical protein